MKKLTIFQCLTGLRIHWKKYKIIFFQVGVLSSEITAQDSGQPTTTTSTSPSTTLPNTNTTPSLTPSTLTQIPANPNYQTPAVSDGKDEINEQAAELWTKLNEITQACQSLQYDCGGQGDACDPLTILEQMEINVVQNACDAMTKNQAAAKSALDCNECSIKNSSGGGTSTTTTGLSTSTSNMPATTTTPSTTTPSTTTPSTTTPTTSTS